MAGRNIERMTEYVLFQRDECHLCDLAMRVLAAVPLPEFDSVWIEGHQSLEQRFGDRVPVLQRVADQAELVWPFDVDAVRRFLDAPLRTVSASATVGAPASS